MDLDFDPRKNVSTLDRVYTPFNVPKNLHHMKYELLYKPFKKTEIPKIPSLVESEKTVSFKYKESTITFSRDYLSEIELVTTINEIYFKNEYAKFNVKDRVIIDIGAFDGDTAILFTLNGAARVYGYEMTTELAKLASQNVRLNNFDSKITIKQSEVSNLDSIINEIQPSNPNTEFSLKMDCEGAEYNILLKCSDNSLLALNQVIMEYHYGYINLVERFKKLGFKVQVSHPHKAMRGKGFEGILYAWR